ncbi:hypothetical protein Ahy_B06g082788 [Arachis hypogaea]|uniref:Uncharacterized protein n=1 Tax=Arachis hypogaea TaxID=3818 RepID=A0A444YNX1_ARAHY|nr:hypothetical protein Ahy_B06g082787 [Arachis hypogaea]RYR03661.1 hypothetical protein Ahy_B06g082788 [Arachis hypogaea]
MQGAARNDKEETMPRLDVVKSQKELSATKGVKKCTSKKLDFTHLQSTLSTINKRMNFTPETLEVQPSIPAQQPENKKRKNHLTVAMAEKKKHEVQHEPLTQGLNNSKLTKVGADELKRKLDAIRNMNNSMPTTVSQDRSCANSTQPTINQRQQQIIQVTHGRTQKRQHDTTLLSSNTTPQAEDLMSEQDGSRKEKSKQRVKATTIDEFLKENGIDVEIDGLSSELSDDVGDSFPYDENYYSHVMEDIDDDEVLFCAILFSAILFCAIIPATILVADEFQNRQAAGETDEEAFESLFGKEQPGRVRCYGRSITRRDLKKHAEISELKQQHQEEVTSLKAELGDMKAKQQHQEADLHGLRNMIKLLVQRSEPGMRPEEIEALLQDAQHSPIDANSAHGSTHIPNINMDNSEDVNED